MFEHSSVGSAFPTARFHGAAHKTKSSLSICVSVRAKSPKADLCIKCWANSNLGTTVGFVWNTETYKLTHFFFWGGGYSIIDPSRIHQYLGVTCPVWDILGCRDACLLLNIMELDDACLVVLNTSKKQKRRTTQQPCLSEKSPFPQPCCVPTPCRKHFLFTELHLPTKRNWKL